MNKETIEKLATAMQSLADRLEKFQDPVLWQKVLGEAARTIPIWAPPPIIQALHLEGVTITLSDDERDKLVTQVYEAVKPEIAAFSEFVRQSLKDMPAHRLKQISEKVAAGEKVELKRRRGCVFLKAGDAEIYLGL